MIENLKKDPMVREYMDNRRHQFTTKTADNILKQQNNNNPFQTYFL